MELKVTRIPKSETETLEIKCHNVSDEVREIVSFIKSRQGVISGKKDGTICEIPISDIFYFESVDNRSFAYTASDNYEINMRIYELEEMLGKDSFVRVQKGMILNLLKIKSIKPGLSGRYVALLKNREEVIISRNYVPALKKTLKGGK